MSLGCYRDGPSGTATRLSGEVDRDGGQGVRPS